MGGWWRWVGGVVEVVEVVEAVEAVEVADAWWNGYGGGAEWRRKDRPKPLACPLGILSRRVGDLRCGARRRWRRG